MPVITVNGEIDIDNLGITDVHEHILFSLAKDFKKPKEYSKQLLSEQKIRLENLGNAILDPFLIKDNLLLSSINVAKSELIEFKKAGGKTIVDATTKGMGRDPIGLKKLSKELGLNIITATGYYRRRYHPLNVQDMSLEEIAEEMEKEIMIGIGDTGIRAGVIGEIGTSESILPAEKKVLIAAAKVNS